MTQVNAIDELIEELNLGRATVKFILNRFSKFFSGDGKDGSKGFGPDTLAVMIRIKDLMDDGLLPSQIEAALEKEDPRASSGPDRKDVRMSRDALGFIQDLFQDIKGHQSRIALAHEKRAEAEERKAVAIEKRAEAEEKKAQAMNNIAEALKEMSRQRHVDAETMEIAGQAAHALTMNEIEDFPPESEAARVFDDPDLSVDLDSDLADGELAELLDHPVLGEKPGDAAYHDDLDLGDLSGLLAEEEETKDLDDLASLIDTVSEPGDPDLSDLLEESPLPEPDDLTELLDVSPGEDIDDLSILLDEENTEPGESDLDNLNLLLDGALPDAPTEDLDDLSQLVPESEITDHGTDNLWDLLDKNGPDDGLPLDDLSQLIDEEASGTEAGAAAIDDLSLLLDEEDATPDSQDLDDLSSLVSDTAPVAGDNLWELIEEAPDQPAAPPMDDLSALIDRETAEPSAPSLKPDITPEQDLGKYKAAVMKIIIDLKEKGFSAGETTDRLNRDKVATLSGKPRWREKAIAKIYGFIDSAK